MIAEPRQGMKSYSSKFIVVSGCNGVGKSTVARALGERLGAPPLRYPDAFQRFRQEAALDAAVAPLPRLLYYLGATLQLSDLVRERLDRGPVVCDRYLESPLSLLVCEGVLAPHEVARLCAPFLPRLRAPDLTLLLTADHAAAGDRIRDRARSAAAVTRSQQLVLDSAEFFHAREAALRAQAAQLGPTAELDTTALDVGAMCAAAWALVARAVCAPAVES